MCLRALVVSAHAVVRSALLSMLDREPGVVSWAEDTTPEDGAADPREDIPNVVLFECGRLDDVAIQRIHELGSRYAGAHVLVLTSSGAQEAMRQALEAGVSGFQGFQEEYGVDIGKIAARRTIDGQMLTIFAGPSSATVLPFGTPEDVRREIERIVDTLATQCALFILPANNILPDCPVENVVAMYRHAAEYGQRPRP